MKGGGRRSRKGEIGMSVMSEEGGEDRSIGYVGRDEAADGADGCV